MRRSFIKSYFNLNINLRYEFIMLSFLILKIQFNKNFEFHLKYRYQNFCYYTGVKRSILNFFLISRWHIKKHMSFFNGVRKLSW